MSKRLWLNTESEIKLVIISGGSKGLGASLVSLFSENNWQVVELSRSGTNSFSVNCDFSQPEKVAPVLEEQFASLSQTDWEKVIVVNNAGTLNPIGQIHTKNHADWVSSININFTSAVLVSGLFLKYFQAHSTNKCIVNISSGAAHKPYNGWSLYCAAKSALESYSNCVALEQSTMSNGANSIIVNPGVIDTDMQQAIRNTSESDFPEVALFYEYKQSGGLQSPDKVAAAVYAIIDSNLQHGGSYNVADYFE